jgi:hypothetical protein
MMRVERLAGSLGVLLFKEYWRQGRMELQVTDPSKAEAFRGEEIDEDWQETPVGDGFYAYRRVLTWNLVREPD